MGVQPLAVAGLILQLWNLSLSQVSAGAPLIAFVFPTATYIKVFWTEEARRNSVYAPVW